MKMIRMISVALLGGLLLSVIFASRLIAQAAPPGAANPYSGAVRFERLAVEDGLPNTTVLSVLQDRQGFMWFATADGVSRYDGYSFTTFRHDTSNPNSLSNNNTFALVESGDGLIWIGTDPGGLNVYNPETGKFSFYTHDPANPNSLINDSIWSLMEARDGSIWIGTRGGLSRLDRASGTFKNYIPNPENPRSLGNLVINRIYQDRSGAVWIASRGGLQRYDPATDDFTTFKNIPGDPTSLSATVVWAILEDSQGVMWVGTRGGGLNRFDRAAGTFRAFKNEPNNPSSLSNNNIWNIYEDLSGNIWIGTENGGLNLFDRQAETFTSFQNNPNDPSTISNNDIFWMVEDRSGVLWVTSRYGGVNKLYPSLWRFGLYRSIPGDPNSLNSNSVYSILAQEDGVIWIGTFGGGLNRFDRKTKTMQVFKNDPANPYSLSNDKIYCIYPDQKGSFWIGTSGGGLNRLDLSTGKSSVYKYIATDKQFAIGSNFITVVKSAGENHLWVGTLGYGLELFNIQTGLMEKEFVHDEKNPNSLTEDTIYDIVVDKNGLVWLATARGGLELLDPQTGVFTHHLNDPANPNSILGNAVNAIYLDEQAGMVWAGTTSGLSGLDLATRQWQNYTVHDGLSSDTIMSLQPDGAGNLWISTGKGISRFSTHTKVFTRYDSRDGLQGDQFTPASSSRAPDGEIFFGGSNGLTFFHPEAVVTNTFLAPVVFTEFQLFNKPVPDGSQILPKPIERTAQIVLNYDQSVFTLKFAALSYQLPGKNLYQYKMEGFDKDWSPPRPKQEVTYTNLPPGNYTFNVRAANNDGIWGDAAARPLTIIVLPPWWETWWFRILAGLGLVVLIVGGVQLRLGQIRTINRDLEIRVNERTQELAEAHEKLSDANTELKLQLAEITELEKEVRELAIRDALTDLYNRRHFSDRIEVEYSRARREDHPIAFLLMDIDNFKKVNDTYGHQAGDRVLKGLAQLIHSQTRRSDIACRYGGEEFMLVLPEIGPENALVRAENFRKEIDEMAIEFKGQTIHITVSIGIAIFPLHGSESDQILTNVDAALYQAKNTGRNKVVMC